MSDAAAPQIPESVTQERTRFLKAVNATKSELLSYAEVIDDFTRWSLGRNELVHVIHNGYQDVFKFELAGTGQVFWAAYPRQKDGAKFIVLPKASDETPETVRDMVRQQFARLDLGAENKGPSIPTLSFRLLFRASVRASVIQAMEAALETIRANTVRRS